MLMNLKHKGFVLNNFRERFFTSSVAVIVSRDSISQTHVDERTSSASQTRFQNLSESQVSVSADLRVYIPAILSCKNIYEVRGIHAQVIVNGFLHELAVANKLLYMYARFGAVADASDFFDEMSVRDSVSWSVMVGGFARTGDLLKCLRIFSQMIRLVLNLDNYTLPMVIRACRDKKDVVVGRSIHDVTLKFGLDSGLYVCAALVDMYAKCGMIDDACKLFDEMPERDLVTWTVMIGAYADSGRADESWILFERMRNGGIVPDKVAMVTIVYACAKLGALHKAVILHDYIRLMKFSLDVILGTAVIDMFAKCGNIDAARAVFETMRAKNVISWSAMIAAYGYHGQARKALELFQMMLYSKICPNKVTFVSVLYACSHSGLVREGLEIFNSMPRYGVSPDVKHYTCMIDLLGRAGRLSDAANMIETMTAEKDESLWSALLGACRIHKNVELAEKAARSLLELEPLNPGHYILLSNIYANARKWEEVAKIRNLMSQRGLKKIPGYTWIEADGKTHQFGVGDRTHPRSNEIYDMLKGLIEKLELAGYAPDTNFVLHDVDEEVKAGMLSLHSEKLAIAFGLVATPEGSALRITKNLRVCGDCHTFCKFVSGITKREVTVRDANRFHHFNEGSCSCGDYW